jgi:hypothetical protein
MNNLYEYLLSAVGKDTWFQLDSSDVMKIRKDIIEIYLMVSEDHIHIIWQEASGRIWERFAPYVGNSFKKTIVKGIFEPNFRGSLKLEDAQGILECDYMPVYSLDQIISCAGATDQSS